MSGLYDFLNALFQGSGGPRAGMLDMLNANDPASQRAAQALQDQKPSGGLRIGGILPQSNAQHIHPSEGGRSYLPALNEPVEGLKPITDRIVGDTSEPTSPILRAIAGLSGKDTASLGGQYPASPQTDTQGRRVDATAVTGSTGQPKTPNASPAASNGSGIDFKDILSRIGIGLAAADPLGRNQGMVSNQMQRRYLDRNTNATVEWLKQKGLSDTEAQGMARNPEILNAYLGQTMAKPQFTQIGTDAFGRPQMGWVNPNTQEITPVHTSDDQGGMGNGAAGSVMGSPTDSSGNPLRGEAYIKAVVPPEMRDYVRAALAYRQNPASLPPRGGLRERVLMWATQADPTYDSNRFGQVQSAMKSFSAGGSSSPAAVMNTGNTALGHLADAFKASKQLGGTDAWGPLNSTINSGIDYYNQRSQNPARNRYNTSINLATNEIVSFYRNGGGNEADIIRTLDELKSAQSPEARETAIKQMADMLHSKVSAFEHTWRSNIGDNNWQQAINGGPLKDYPVLSKNSAEAYKTIMGEYPPGYEDQAPVAGEVSNPSVTPPSGPAVQDWSTYFKKPK